MDAPADGWEVDAVVFDVGGVLLDWDPARVYGDLTPDERAWLLSEVCTPAWNATLDAGRPVDDAIAELAGRFPSHAHLVERWRRQDDMIAGPVEANVALLGSLRRAGVPVYLLTNMPADVFDDRARRFPFLRDVDGAVVSGREGICKPDPQVFSLLERRHRLVPGRSLFIDDSEANIDAAGALGWVARLIPPCASIPEAVGPIGVPGWG